MILRSSYRAFRSVVQDARIELRQIGSAGKMRGATKLHLGAGEQPIEGWLNLDLDGFNVCWDLTRPLPIEAGTVEFVYSEHFIEHVSRPQGLEILKGCYRVLKHGGRIRISTPDLKKLASDYLAGDIVQMPHGNWFPQTPCQMVNEAMRLWGHQFVYDEVELTALVVEAGFGDVRRMKWRESDETGLKNLETRPDFGDLILEAVKAA